LLNRSCTSLAPGLLLCFILIGCGSGNTGPGGGGGGSQSSAPVLSSISPLSVVTTSTAFTLVANGSNFTSTSQIEWNGGPLATTFVSSIQLSAVVPSPDAISSGTSQVSVLTPGAGGGTSNLLSFTVTSLIPELISIAPSSATVGSPAITLTVMGARFDSKANVQWNGSALPTTYVSSTQLTAQVPATDLSAASSALITVSNPAPGGGQSGSLVFYVNSGATRMTVVSANANQIVWDATNQRMYASLASTNNGANNNTVAAIDPVTGTIYTVQSAGVQPDVMDISSDASYLWVAEDGSNAVQRFTLPNLTPDITIPIPASTTFGPQTAIALKAAPTAPHTAAVLEGNYSDDSPDTGGVVIYDDAAPRATIIPSFPAFGPDITWLTWGADASTLYGGNEDIPPTYYTLSVNSAGVTVSSKENNVLPTPGHFDSQTGYLYADYGQVVNPATGDSMGSFNLTYLSSPETCAVDSAQGVVFCLGKKIDVSGVSGYEIQAFDQKTYRLLRTLSFPQIIGTAVNFVRWGNAGLAFNIIPLPYQTLVPITGSIYLIDGSFVDGSATPDFTNGTAIQPLPVFASMSPQNVSAGASDVTLNVMGGNFEPGAVVSWGVNALHTVYISPSQLQATIPATDLAAAGTTQVSLSNGDVLTQAPTSMAFTVTPQNVSLTTVNLASLDVAWDPVSALLYAAVWSGDPQYPNSVVAINPTTGQVVNSQYAGSDPYIVRTTADGAFLYTANIYSDSVTQLKLPGLNSPVTWQFGSDPSLGAHIAIDVQPAPGASQTTAISTGAFAYDPFWLNYGEGAVGGLRIFDNSVPRPTQALDGANAPQYSYLQWGSNDTTLYSTGSSVYTFSISSSGLTQTANDTAIYGNNYNSGYIRYDAGTGDLYDNNGNVIDPSTGTILGNFGSTGITVPDSSLNLVFILGQTIAQRGSTNYTITSFNQTTFAPVSSFTLTSVVQTPVALVRWGSTGLALVTYENDDTLYLTPLGVLYILNDAGFVTAAEAGAQPQAAPQQVQRTWKPVRLPIHSTPTPHTQQGPNSVRAITPNH
jgi:hypothetical protein